MAGEASSAWPPEAAEARLLRHTLALCRLAKAARLPVSQGRVIDCCRAVRAVDLTDRESFRLSLRLNLASSHAEERTFDDLFDRYFAGEETVRLLKPGIRGETMRGRLRHHDKPLDQDLVADAERFSADAPARDIDLASRWDPNALPLEQIIRELARRLATRPSRRTRPDRRGARVDLRRAVRRNARHGMDLVELTRSERRTRKTRLVMLCDVSGSMDAFNPFLLRLMFGLQQVLKNSRTLVFSTRVTEITGALRRRSVAETLREIGETVRHWSGGTDIGGALAQLNRGALREGSASTTVLVVISDGYDNGDSALIAREMQALRRRVRTVVWINPMYGATTFQVRAAGMRAALPYVDHFLPAFDNASLRVLVRELARV